jgi:hypothetical protein
MDRAETQAYVEHRLGHVGWKGDPRFEAPAFDLIHTASGGIPRRINTLCNRLLLAGFLGEKHAFGSADVQAIVREIREELGPEASLVTVAGAPEESEARELKAPATTVEAETAADPQSSLAHFREIEARLDRLEKSVGRAIGLLQRLLHPERLGKPGAPMGR